MVERGYVHHDYCFNTGFNNDGEKKRLIPLIKADYQKFRQSLSNFPEKLNSIDHIQIYGVNCLKQAKLINFEFNCKEAYATYSCDVGDYVQEFTYSGNRNEKCSYIGYKKSWEIKPKRTLYETYNTIMTYPKSIFNSPECEPTTK